MKVHHQESVLDKNLREEDSIKEENESEKERKLHGSMSQLIQFSVNQEIYFGWESYKITFWGNLGEISIKHKKHNQLDIKVITSAVL